MKRGVECSLLLKHSKGKVTAMLQSTTPRPCSTLSSSSPSPSSAKRRKKGSKEKRLKALLDYHQRLVVERGLPPSRLMEQHAAASAVLPPPPDQSLGPRGKLFNCDQCDFSSDSQRGLKVHVGRSHKVQQAAEILREDLDVSLSLSQLSDEREEHTSSVNADISSTPVDMAPCEHTFVNGSTGRVNWPCEPCPLHPCCVFCEVSAASEESRPPQLCGYQSDPSCPRPCSGAIFNVDISSARGGSEWKVLDLILGAPSLVKFRL